LFDIGNPNSIFNRMQRLTLRRFSVAMAVFLLGGSFCLNVRADSTWPNGTNGDLTINAGEVSEFSAGSVYNFSNVTINAGGVLSIGPGDEWTIIGVSGNLVLKGIIQSKTATYCNDASKPVAIVATAPDGFILNARVGLQPGGTGGSQYGTPQYPANSGQGEYGNGGGGAAAFGSGHNSSPAAGGSGGTCSFSQWIIGRGGDGGEIPSGDGSAGDNAFSPTDHNGHVGGGGGGGARGSSGGFLYLRVKGRIDAVGGSFDFSGSNGGKGGNGGSADGNPATTQRFGGAAGGGGAGGNGGFVVIRHDDTYLPGVFSVSPGQGGFGGSPGNPVTGTAGLGHGGKRGLYGSFILATTNGLPVQPNATPLLLQDLPTNSVPQAIILN
jgi:hypothetical protein